MMRVRVYRNLHKDCLSVQSYVPGKGWRLHSHTPSIGLYDVRFIVSEAGRQRVLRTRRKTVHALVEGEAVDVSLVADQEPCGMRVSYNPYKAAHFYQCDTGDAVHAAPMALVTTRGAYVPEFVQIMEG